MQTKRWTTQQTKTKKYVGVGSQKLQPKYKFILIKPNIAIKI
jgi:hypothetical protein